MKTASGRVVLCAAVNADRKSFKQPTIPDNAHPNTLELCGAADAGTHSLTNILGTMAKLKLARHKPTAEFSLTRAIEYSIKADRAAFAASGVSDHKPDRAFHLSKRDGVAMALNDPLYCSRRQEIARAFYDEIPAWVPEIGLQKVFDLGHEIHGQHQKYLRNLGRYSNGFQGLYGRWKCKVCKRTWYEFAAQGCGSCGASMYDLTYREYPLNNKKYEIKTTCDGLLWNYDGEEWGEWLLELKSIKAQASFYGDIGFAELFEPMPKHVMQAQGYAGIRNLELSTGTLRKLPSGFAEWPTFKGVIYGYINKNTGEFKEFQQPYDPVYWKTIRQRILSVQRNEANHEQAPRLSICDSIENGKKLAKCDLAELCFKRFGTDNPLKVL